MASSEIISSGIVAFSISVLLSSFFLYSYSIIFFVDEDLVHSSAGSSSTGASMHQQESLRSYPPLPHGIVKVEAQSGDDHGDFTS